MPKAPSALDEQDFIIIRNHSKTDVWRLIRADPVRHRIQQTLTASQDSSGNNLTELRSAADHIFYIAAVELENDINLYLNHRNKNLIGFTGEQFLTIDVAPIGSPFPLNLWAYIQEPVARYVNNLNAQVTGTTYYYGIDWTIEKLSDAEAREVRAQATPVFG